MTLEEFLKIDVPTVEDFLQLEHPREYDFSNDTKCENYKIICDPIEKYIWYTAYFDVGRSVYERENDFLARFIKKAKIRFNGIADPDSHSPLLQKIYRSLWSNGQFASNLDPCITVSGDTLNSCRTSLDKTMEYIDNEEETNGCLSNSVKRKGYYSKKYSLALFANEYDEAKDTFSGVFIDSLEKRKYFKRFIGMYHTLGNFMPVPAGCNSPRGTGKTNDYWDSALKIIYEYYIGKADNIADIVRDDVALKKYRAWLDTYIVDNNKEKGWQNFIEKNFLQDFVNRDIYHYGTPKELWPGHISKDIFLQEDEYGLNEDEVFYKRASAAIEKRGKRMIDKLKIVLEKNATDAEPCN